MSLFNPDTPSFFCQTPAKVTGPFDLIELAAELRYGNITADTPVRSNETEPWRSLRDLSEFAAVQSISIEEIASHLEEKARGGVPTPSDVPRSFPWIIPVAALLISGGLVVALILIFGQDTPEKHVAHRGSQYVNKER
jgi:hypothetical protein